MGKSKAPSPPVIPTSGEELAGVIDVLTERLPELQALQVADIIQNLAQQAQFVPAFAGLQLAQEAQLGGLQRAAQSEASRQSLAGQLFNIGALTPGIRQAEAFAFPETEALRTELGRQIGGELQAGAALDPELRREFQQQVRSAQTARGISFGAAPIAEEALFVGGRAAQLRRQRQEAAQNLIRLNAATQVSPFQFAAGFGGAPGAPGAQLGQQQIPTGGIAQQFLPQLQQQEAQRGLLRAQQGFNAAQLAPGGFLGQGGSLAGGAGLGAVAGAAGAGFPVIALASLAGLA